MVEGLEEESGLFQRTFITIDIKIHNPKARPTMTASEPKLMLQGVFAGKTPKCARRVTTGSCGSWRTALFVNTRYSPLLLSLKSRPENASATTLLADAWYRSCTSTETRGTAGSAFNSAVSLNTVASAPSMSIFKMSIAALIPRLARSELKLTALMDALVGLEDSLTCIPCSRWVQTCSMTRWP